MKLLRKSLPIMKRTAEPAGQRAHNQKHCDWAWWAGSEGEAHSGSRSVVGRGLLSRPVPHQAQVSFALGRAAVAQLGEECMCVGRWSGQVEEGMLHRGVIWSEV